MKEDMQMRGSERTRRENKFHGDDDAITVDDLWEAWFESIERTWTNERVKICFCFCQFGLKFLKFKVKKAAPEQKTQKLHF